MTTAAVASTHNRLVPVEILLVELKNEGMIVLPVPRQPGHGQLADVQLET